MVIFTSSQCLSHNLHEPLWIIHFIFNLKTARKIISRSNRCLSVSTRRLCCYRQLYFFVFCFPSLSWPSKLPKSNAMPNKLWFDSNIRVENGNFLCGISTFLSQGRGQDRPPFLSLCTCVCGLAQSCARWQSCVPVALPRLVLSVEANRSRTQTKRVRNPPQLQSLHGQNAPGTRRGIGGRHGSPNPNPCCSSCCCCCYYCNSCSCRGGDKSIVLWNTAQS